METMMAAVRPVSCSLDSEMDLDITEEDLAIAAHEWRAWLDVLHDQLARLSADELVTVVDAYA
jgi:hypothetical protein